MEIKIKTLRKIVVLLCLLSVISIISYYIYDKKRTEEIRKTEIRRSLEEAIDREYKDLLREYDSMWKTVQDHSYSIDFRIRYLYKLNDLLEQPNRYTEYEKCSKEEFEERKKEDKVTLKKIAAKNVYKKIIGDN